MDMTFRIFVLFLYSMDQKEIEMKKTKKISGMPLVKDDTFDLSTLF